MAAKQILRAAVRIALIALCAALFSPFQTPGGRTAGASGPVEGPPVLAQPTPHAVAHLPLVMHRHPPLPDRPTLLPIDNADEDGDYAVAWQASLRADTYELEERRDEDDRAVAYRGAATDTSVLGRPAGVYTYRVRALNGWGYGLWSDERATTVAGAAPGQMPQPPSRSQDAAGLALVRVINDCPYALTLQFTGPDPQTLPITRCEVCHVYTFIGPIFCPTQNRPVEEISLVPGSYRVYATVDQPDVRPYVGDWDLAADRRYSLCFYILRR